MSESKNKRIAKNTVLLYFRMLLMMFITLYTSRVILKALGMDDYGIYNVVGGVVAMFSILSQALSSAITRFINFKMGQNDMEGLKRVFCTSINIQVVLSFLIIVLMETVGLWFLNEKMVIPESRMIAANWVFQLSIVTFVVGLLAVPYNASIIAHEKMSAFAYISILDAILKLLISYLVVYEPFDRLVYYALLLVLLSLLNRFIYAIYCKKHFEECSYHFIWDKEMMREMFGFAGWNFIGSASAVLRSQGGNIIINLFYGPAVNAARGISMQVNHAVSGFVSNFMTAVKPQITQSYAAGNYDYMMTLVFQSARLSFYILLILSLPIIFTTPYLLQLWLGQVPEHTVNFVRLVLIFTMSESLANPLIYAMLATGNIRNYQLLVGGFQILNLPISYFLLRFGYPPEWIFIVAIVISVVCELCRLWMLRSMIHLSIPSFLKNVYFNVIGVSLISAVLPYLYTQFNVEYSMKSFFIMCVLCVLSAILTILSIGCNSSERQLLFSYVQKISKKMRR